MKGLDMPDETIYQISAQRLVEIIETIRLDCARIVGQFSEDSELYDLLKSKTSTWYLPSDDGCIIAAGVEMIPAKRAGRKELLECLNSRS